VGQYCSELVREIQEIITCDEFSYSKPQILSNIYIYIYETLSELWYGNVKVGSSKKTLSAREIFSCGSGCSPGVEILKLGLKKANKLVRSVTVSFSKDSVFRGVNVSKLRIM